ncbi:MAG: 30S ribosomal protein S12 methylthiotransferase RimO [Acidimicrobiales bacterium]
MESGRFWLHTLGCPKNQVDSDKLSGVLAADGYLAADRPEDADLVVVNTCAFIEAARQESIGAVLELAAARRPGARLVVTGCMAERYGDELAAALPEADLVAGFGQALAPQPVALGRRPRHPTASSSSFDLLSLSRPPATAPWAYVKVAEGCDRRCGFCAIPSFRGKQRSRPVDEVLAEVASLASGDGPPLREVVLVAQDLASFGRDHSGRRRRGPGEPDVPGAPPGAVHRRRTGRQPIVPLVRAVAELVARVRLLYLYPSGLTEELVEAVLDTGVPYFDLSLQHVSRPHLARMRRWGDGERFLDRIARIRRADPEATFRSSFILGYPGETEEDHDALLAFLGEATLDWAGFFPFSREEGTHAAGLPDQVPAELALERLRECAELQDEVTARRRDALVGRRLRVLVDGPGVGRSVHEAPEIDGVVRLPAGLAPGELTEVSIVSSAGVDLVGAPVAQGADGLGAAPVGAAPGVEVGAR